MLDVVAVSTPYTIFLGGHDLEMATIGKLARAAGIPVEDRGLSWGARASDYRREIELARAGGRVPVLVEMPWDLPTDAKGVVLIDHHGDGAGIDKPSALRQIHNLLKMPPDSWTREFALIEANDIGWIPAMQALGADAADIRRIREADRAAQGVTVEEEAAAERAITGLRWSCGGRLAIVDSPHDRSSPITDRLHPALGGAEVSNILILGPREIQFFGEGQLVHALDKDFPGGWFGGALPIRGYWGAQMISGRDDVAKRLEEWLLAGSSQS